MAAVSISSAVPDVMRRGSYGVRQRAPAYQNAGDTVEWAKGKQLSGFLTMIEVFLREQALHSTEAAELIGAIPQIGEMVARNDRDGLFKMLMPGYQKAVTKYGVDALGIVTPPALTVARMHNPGKFGDDQSSYQPMLVFTNQTREVQSGLEIASVAGVRGVVLIYNGATHVGALEIAPGFGAALAELKVMRIRVGRCAAVGRHLPGYPRFPQMVGARSASSPSSSVRSCWR